jgi:hypothetical protein
MTTMVTKFQMGTAACVIAAAAALTPAAVATAQPPAPIPMVGIGGAACDPVGLVCGDSGADNGAPGAGARSSLSAGAPNNIFQNPLWWFGTPNPNPPPQTQVVTFYPLALLPAFIRPLFGWFENANFEACIGGLTLHIGPYGALSGSYSRGCA